MANISLKIVGLGDFSSVTEQLKAVQLQVDTLNKSIAGTAMGANLKGQLTDIQNQFKATMLSSGQFTAQTVQLTSETQKFGKALESGKLSLGNYFGIITGKSAEAQKAVAALAVEQVKLNNSVVAQDITKNGIYTVYTPTNIDKISKATEIAAAKQNIYNIAVQQGSQKLIDFGKNTQWAGRQLTVGLTMPALLFGQQAVQSFQAVNVELTRLQRLYGLGLTPPSTAQLNAVSKDVLALGASIASTMGIAQSETVKAAANFAAMGKMGNDLITITQQAMRLSKLGGIDTQASTNAIVALQNVYRVSSTNLADAVNFLSDMQKQTTMSLGDMTDAIPRVGPIMQQLGGTYKDTAVMLLAMKEAGVPAAQSANALKSAMASLIAPTKAATTEASAFGISLDAVKNAGTPVQMIEKLQAGLAGLAPLAREQIIEKIFGKFQFARVSALLDNFGRIGSQTQNALKVAGATSAELATLANQEMTQATSSPSAKWQKAVEGLKASLYPIGQKIIEVGSKILEFGQKVADFFNKLPGPIKSGLGVLLTLGVIAGPIIMITGLLANLMGQVMKVGYSFMGVINGSKKWKDLMTPASIAARNATEVFNEGLINNTTSVDLLNAAIQRLTMSLTALSESTAINTGVGSILTKAEQVAASSAGTASKSVLAQEAGSVVESTLLKEIPLMGMATGGWVPGNPAQGDSFPALLMGGEAVIPTEQAKRYAPFISAMLSGKLPQHAAGVERFEELSASDIGRKAEVTSFPGTIRKKIKDIVWSSKRDEEDIINKILNEEGISESGNAGQNAKRTESAHTSHRMVRRYSPVLEKPYDIKDSSVPSEAQAEWGAINGYGATISDKNGAMSGPVSSFLGNKGALDRTAKELGTSVDDLVKQINSMRDNFVADTKEHAIIIKNIAAEDKATESYITKINKDVLAHRANSDYYKNDLPTSKANPETAARQHEVGAKRYGYALDMNEILAKPELQTPENLKKLESGASEAGMKITPGSKLHNLLYKSGAQAATAIDSGARGPQGMDAHSPSQVATVTGHDYVAGLQKGVQLELPLLGTEVAKGVENLNNEVKIAIKSNGSEMHQALLQSAKEAEKAVPAFKSAGQKLGKAEVQGVQQELNLHMNDMKPKTGIQNQIESMFPSMNSSNAISSANSAFNKQSLQERFSGAFGSESKVGGALSKMLGSESKLGGLVSGGIEKYKGMGMMGKMGVGMGLGMVSQMAAPAINKVLGNTAGGLANDALSGASMGMQFGPWGAAAGAALGVAIGGIKDLMASEKLHKQEAAADFKSSSDAMSFFGQSVANTTHQVSTFATTFSTLPGKAAEAAKGIQYTSTEISSFTKMVQGLPKDNPLSLVVQQLKDTGDSGSALKIAQQFANMQMAVNGMSKENADKLVQMMLTMSGHSALGAGASAADQVSAIRKELEATAPDIKRFTAFVGQLSDLQINTTSWKTYQAAIDAIGTSATQSALYVESLINYLQQVGDTGGAQEVISLQAHGYSAIEISNIRKALAGGVSVDTNKYTPADAKAIADLAQKGLNNQAAAAKATADATNGLTNATNNNTTANGQNLTSLQAQQKVLQANLKALQDAQKAQQQNQTEASTEQDIKNQILMAQANGDNLKAVQLQQQLINQRSSYNGQSAIDAAQKKVDQNQELITAIQDSQKAVTAASGATTSAVTTGTSTTGTNIANAANAIVQGKLSGSGAAPVAGVDVTGMGGSTAEVDKWAKDNKIGKTFSEFAGKGAQWLDPVTGKLSVGAQRYVINYGNNGKGYESKDEFSYNGQGYSVGTGKSAVGTAQATALAPGVGVVPSDRQRYVGGQTASFPIDSATINNWITQADQGVNKFIKGGARNPSYYLLKDDGKGGTFVFDKSGKLTGEGKSLVQKNSPISAGVLAINGRLYRYDGNKLIDQGAQTGGSYQGSTYTPNSAHMADGGHISGPGTATSDSIPAMLSNGEYVVKADSVSHYGKGFFDAVNAQRYAKGGVARTNSSITYHKQHMNRTSRHFADGGLVQHFDGGGMPNPISSTVGYISTAFNKKVSSILKWITTQTNEMDGTAPAGRILQGKSQGLWDYVGAGTSLVPGLKEIGLIPKMLMPIARIAEGLDVGQNALTSAKTLAPANVNSPVHITINAANASAEEVAIHAAKYVDAAMKRNANIIKMSGTMSKVGI